MIVKNAERMVVDIALKMGHIKLANTFIGFDVEAAKYRPIPLVDIAVSDILCINRNIMLLDNTIRQCTEAVLDINYSPQGRILPAPDFILVSVLNVSEDNGVVATIVHGGINFQMNQGQYGAFYAYDGSNYTDDENKRRFEFHYDIMDETLYLGINEYYNLCRAGHYTHYTSVNAMPKEWIQNNYENSPDAIGQALSDPLNASYMITHPGMMEDVASIFDKNGFYPKEVIQNQYYKVIPEMKDQATGQLLQIVDRVPISTENQYTDVPLPPKEAQEPEKDWVPKGIKVGEDGKPEALVIENTRTGEVKLITP